MENSRTSAKPALEIALALSGGAARGTFHLGFIHALQEHDVVIKAISGTSAGALIGGAIACGTSPKEILNILQSKEFKSIFKFNWFRESIFSIDGEADVVKKLFPLQDLKETKIPFYACITDIDSHETIHANRGDGKKLILSSCSLIPIFTPVEYEGKNLADGGILDLMPTSPLLKYNCPILGINLVPTSPPNRYTFFSSSRRGAELLLNTTLPKDIKKCNWYIAPNELRNIKLFSLLHLEIGFDLGYKHGLKWCTSQL